MTVNFRILGQSLSLCKPCKLQYCKAVPYDMYVWGYDTEGVSVLRLWKAEAPSIDMNLFNSGDYSKALGQNTIAQAISRFYT